MCLSNNGNDHSIGVLALKPPFEVNGFDRMIDMTGTTGFGGSETIATACANQDDDRGFVFVLQPV